MPFQGKTVSFHTLGCKLNFSETSTIARLMQEKGFVKVAMEQGADVCVINTCSVTENADKECKQIVKQALSKNPETFIAVVGCYAQLKPDEISNIEGVDVVLGASEKFKLLNYISHTGKHTHTHIHNCEISDVHTFEGSFSAGDRTRSFLKVQDGCDYSCTFCTIPLARGKSRSDTLENAVANAKKIADSGVKEIVLTGVNLGDFGYGIDIDLETKKRKEYNFLDLVQALDNVEGIERIRISSIEPNLLKDEVIEFVAKSKHFAPHFHVPLQSGSNDILALMKRRYKKELYQERVSKIKALMPHCCIGVDVIVGFPGETLEHFNETYRFLNELDVSYLHVFTYSERDNTEAIHLADAVDMSERKRRNKMLRILSAKKLRHFYEQNLNKPFTVLFEHENKNGTMYGFTENYLKIAHPFNEALVNKLTIVTPNALTEDGFVGIEVIESIPVI